MTSPRSAALKVGVSLLTVLTIMALAKGCSEPGGAATITIKGTEVRVEWRRHRTDRAGATADHSRLVDGAGILVGWGGDRIQHYHSTGSAGGYDVLFLAADGRVVERASLKANSDEGVTSEKESSFALFLAEGWLARHNATDADRVGLGAGVTANPAEPLPTIKLGGTALRVEVAETADRQRRGLMHRRTMSADDGMIFLYKQEQQHSFWMGNCHYALDIAYFDRDGKFVNVVPMDPYADPKGDGARAPSDRPAQFVVETHKGWFRRKGLVDDAGKATKDLRLEIPAEVRALIR